MKPGTILLQLFVLALLSTGCEMADEDRCTDGLEWAPEQAACIEPIDTDEPEDVDTSPVQDGLGAECWAQDECDMYAPDGPTFCLLDPTDSSVEGMCSFTDCTYDDCGGDFECCDCSESTIFPGVFGPDHPSVLCADSGTAGVLSSILCTCE